MPHHVEIYVSNLSQSRTFYNFLLPELGYSLYKEWPQGFSYKKAEQYIVFVQVEEKYADSTYHRCRVGLNYLSFHGGTRARVQALKEKLQARGVSMLYEDGYPYAGGDNYFACFFEDPDRIKLEIVAEE